MSEENSVRVARALIDEKEFRELVAGRVVRLTALRDPDPAGGLVTVDVMLVDIGWTRMIDAIFDALPPELSVNRSRRSL